MKRVLRRAPTIGLALLGAAALAAPVKASDRADSFDSLLERAVGLLFAGTAIGMAAASDGMAAVSGELVKIDPAVRGMAVPVLASWIAESRDAAVREGVQGVPAAIRTALTGYVPDEILERARWRVGGGGVLSLQQTLFRSGYVPAVTLDYVIVFEREREAYEDAALWAHELKHVMQYSEWGLNGFAARYVEDYSVVEAAASDYRKKWLEERSRQASR